MTTMRWVTVALATLGLLGVTTVDVREVDACGACLGPPPDPRNPTGVQTVTDHRMALALSATQTTLWDQFSWAGAPDQFSWILPVAHGPDVRVELASDDFLTLLDNHSSPQGTRPRVPSRTCGHCVARETRCPADTRQTPTFDASTTYAPPQDATSADAGSVNVYRDEIVGPYEVVVLGGDDSGALRGWLTTHGFAVPTALEPTLAYYVSLHMDFVALRLAGSNGVQRMQPVRVTTPGAQPTLPLRMVAGGVGDHVGLLLFVFSTARMEAMNFPNTEITDRDLVYDFNDPTDFANGFRTTATRLSNAADGRAWNTEYARGEDRAELLGEASGYDDYQTRFRDAGLPAGDAGVRATATDDVNHALVPLSRGVYLTRMRADLTVPKLDRDLQLQASVGGTRDRPYRFDTLRHMPTPEACPALHCQPGDTEVTYGDVITGPYYETLPADAQFGDEYIVGSITSIERPAETVRLIPGAPATFPCPGLDGGFMESPDGAVVPAAHIGCATSSTLPVHTRAIAVSVFAMAGVVVASRRRRAR